MLIIAYFYILLYVFISYQNGLVTVSLFLILALSFISLAVAETFLCFACKQAATLFQE